MGNLTLNGATSGQITLAPPAVAGTNTLTLPAATGTVLTTAGGQTVSGNTTVSGTVVMGSPFTMRNKIINGAMMIDQRYAGAATANTISGYNIDRFQIVQTVTGKLIAQQNAGSVTPPAGFVKYQGITSQSAYSVLAGDYYLIQQAIEGVNIADLAWGTASAATVTLSFWVRSSLTGTFGGSLRNSASNRCYPFSYTISSANTWEQKTITVVGDTTGTWVTDSTAAGIWVLWGLGVGSTYGSGTAGAWVGSQVFVPSGSTSFVGTNGATFYITGVQLEIGTVATPFEYRNYQQELAMCQRYYEVAGRGLGGVTFSTAYANASFTYAVVKRTTPTIALLTTSPAISQFGTGGFTATSATISGSAIGSAGAYVQWNGYSGLTSNQGFNVSTDPILSISAEL